MLDAVVAILDVGMFVLFHPKTYHFGGFEEVDEKVIKHYTLAAKLNLASSNKALVTRGSRFAMQATMSVVVAHGARALSSVPKNQLEYALSCSLVSLAVCLLRMLT